MARTCSKQRATCGVRVPRPAERSEGRSAASAGGSISARSVGVGSVRGGSDRIGTRRPRAAGVAFRPASAAFECLHDLWSSAHDRCRRRPALRAGHRSVRGGPAGPGRAGSPCRWTTWPPSTRCSRRTRRSRPRCSTRAPSSTSQPWGSSSRSRCTASCGRTTGLKVASLVLAVAYLGFVKASLVSVVDIFGAMRGTPAGMDGRAGLLPPHRVHAGLDGAVGAPVLRADLRVRGPHAAHGPGGAGTPPRRAAGVARSAPRLPQVRGPRGRRSVCPRGRRHPRVPLHRAVLDVHAQRQCRDVDAARGCCCWRRCSCATSTAATCARWGRVSGCCPTSPSSASSGGASATRASSARRRASGGAIDGPKILVSECVRCDDCERLYADEDRCPHWLIQKRARRPRGAGVTGSTGVRSNAVKSIDALVSARWSGLADAERERSHAVKPIDSFARLGGAGPLRPSPPFSSPAQRGRVAAGLPRAASLPLC